MYGGDVQSVGFYPHRADKCSIAGRCYGNRPDIDNDPGRRGCDMAFSPAQAASEAART